VDLNTLESNFAALNRQVQRINDSYTEEEELPGAQLLTENSAILHLGAIRQDTAAQVERRPIPNISQENNASDSLGPRNPPLARKRDRKRSISAGHEQNKKRAIMARQEQDGTLAQPESTRSSSPLSPAAYQLQLMQLEEQNKRRLMMARQAQDGTPAQLEPTRSPSTTDPLRVEISPEIAGAPGDRNVNWRTCLPAAATLPRSTPL
jgi:hypothetical protein